MPCPCILLQSSATKRALHNTNKAKESNGFCSVHDHGHLGPPRLSGRRDHHRARQVHGDAVDPRPRHLLRRRDRGGDHGWGVRVRQPVRDRVRHGHGGAEHDAVPRRLRVRDVLPDAVRGGAGLLPGLAGDHGHCDQPVPPQLGAGLQRRRLVQPAAHPLRPRQAGLHEDGRLARRHRARHLPQGAVRAQGRAKVRVPGEPLLAARLRHERRRRRGRPGHVGQGLRRRRPCPGMGADEPQLGRRVPGLRSARRPRAQLQAHLLHHRADHHRRRRHATELVRRAHVPGPLQLLLGGGRPAKP